MWVLWFLLQMMNISQRQESPVRPISGKKIINCVACTVKQIRSLSPLAQDNICREQTFQTDSFKQILTKRSCCPTNKDNGATMSINKLLMKIKEEPPLKKGKENYKNNKSSHHKYQKKCTTISLKKLFKQDKSIEHKNSKSVSPSRLALHEYRSGPTDKRNYLSNASKTSREVFQSKSLKNLIERNKHHARSALTPLFKQQRKNKKYKKCYKKGKKSQQHKRNKKQSSNYSQTELIAKEFDSLLRPPPPKHKKRHIEPLLKKKPKSKSKSKSKQKKTTSNKYAHKLHSCESAESGTSSPKPAPTTKSNTNRRERLSFEPNRKKGKHSDKAKTEALSPGKHLDNIIEAQSIIQKYFLGALISGYFGELYRLWRAARLIQRVWRGYVIRKHQKMAKKRQEEDKHNSEQKQLFLIEPQKYQNELLSMSEMSPPKQDELANLLEEILKQENVNQQIKVKINDFLKKENKNSARSNSAENHIQQQIRSQKRYFEEMQRKKCRFGSPVLIARQLQPAEIDKSPQLMIENLLTIKQFQRSKLIHNAQLQIEGLQNLVLKKLFSPRTRDAKKHEINQRLEEELQKFDESMTEVIRTCKDTEEEMGQVRPFTNELTPERDHQPQRDLMHSPKLPEGRAETGEKLQDLSMQLLEYYENTQEPREQQYEKLDPSFSFIEDYLFNLFKYIRKRGHSFREHFIQLMQVSRNLSCLFILQNLNVLTDESDEEDDTFKLPLYKYKNMLQKNSEILAVRTAEEFNNSFRKKQRHHRFELNHTLEDIYLKMIIDAFNEALNLERPYEYIFTESILMGKATKMRRMREMEGEDAEDNESEFSLYFANSMNHIYKWAHYQCGRPLDPETDEETLKCLNEKSLKELLKGEMLQQENYYDELLEVIVGLADCLFEEMAMEMMEDAAALYL